MSKKTFTIAEIEWEDEKCNEVYGELGEWYFLVERALEVFRLYAKVVGDDDSGQEHYLPDLARAKEKSQEIIAEWLSPYLVERGSE